MNVPADAANFLQPGGTVTTQIDGSEPTEVAWPVADWVREASGSGYAERDTFTMPFGPPGAGENSADVGSFGVESG
ncbi:MAG: hypothetical protein AAGJ46_05250 [Planctomycetota bacterium]